MLAAPTLTTPLSLLALLAGLCSLDAHGQAAVRACEQPVRYAAEWFPAPDIDNGKSSTQITALGSTARSRGLQLGHVVVDTKLSVQPQGACIGVLVTLAFVKPVLRVASEIPPDSCAYARVMNHENTHVRIWREIAARFRQLSYPWPTGAKSAEILAHAKRELATLVRAQQEFDSPEEYAKNQTVCDGEIGRLVKAPSLPGARPGASPGARPGALPGTPPKRG